MYIQKAFVIADLFAFFSIIENYEYTLQINKIYEIIALFTNDPNIDYRQSTVQYWLKDIKPTFHFSLCQNVYIYIVLEISPGILMIILQVDTLIITGMQSP